jgi:tRNA(adenine34) deaminase
MASTLPPIDAVWDDAMKRALRLARRALVSDDVPVGALVIDAAGRVVGEGWNQREASGDPTAHAEIVAIRAAAAGRGCDPGHDLYTDDDAVYWEDNPVILRGASAETRNLGAASANNSSAAKNSTVTSPRPWDLSGCTIVVTLEPCVMCAGALLAARIDRLVFGAWDAKAGAVGSVWDLIRDERGLRSAEVTPGVRDAECVALLTNFFAARR